MTHQGEQFLRWLVGPLEPSEFLDNYWQKTAVHIPGGPEKLASLGFDLASYKRGLAEPGASSPNLKAQYFDSTGRHSELHIQPSQAESLLAAGLTIHAPLVGSVHSELHAKISELRGYLRHAGAVVPVAFMSPPKSGFGIHFDDGAVFSIQVSGEKIWRYSREPAVPFPSTNLVGSNRLEVRAYCRTERLTHLEMPRATELVRSTLGPGDVLYIPPGCWHQTESGDGYSLGLSISFRSFATRQLVFAVLGEVFRGKVGWRQSIPAAPGDSTAAVEPFLRQRLVELQGAVAALETDDLLEAWKVAVGLRASLHDDEDDAAPSDGIQPDAVLRVPFPIAYRVESAPDGTQEIRVWCLGNSITVGLDGLPVVERLSRCQSFVARDVADWVGDGCQWDEVSQLVADLEASGIVTRAS